MEDSHVKYKETLDRFHEVVEAYAGDGNLGYNTDEEVNNQKGDFSKIRELKKKHFEKTILAIVIAATLSSSVGMYAGSVSGKKVGYDEGYKDALQSTTFEENDINYTIDNAPDIVILKYLDYAVEVDPNLYDDYREINGLFEAYKDEVEKELKNKQNSSSYAKFREKSKNISSDISFEKFKYSIALDQEGNVIKDNTSNYYIDNENCEVYFPAYEKIDSNDLKDGEFIKDGKLYVKLDNEASLYNKKSK